MAADSVRRPRRRRPKERPSPMRILMIGKYPPIQGGVCADNYWAAQLFKDLGHEVHVLTNAEEVEAEYRIAMDEEDRVKLTGFDGSGRIGYTTTRTDRRHFHVPQSNLFVSKLVSLGLELCGTFKPDVIWAYYVEPYGVAALYLHKLTQIPYIIRHAGSDIGRLMLTEQLRRLYEEVFRQAHLVLTHESHYERVLAIGVREDRIGQPVTCKLPEQIFYPREPRPIGETVKLGVYGKAGNVKATREIVLAMQKLSDEGFRCHLKAHWGGRSLPACLKGIDTDAMANVDIRGFVPHWKIADFIRERDMILYLENNFPIKFHGPGLPMEVLACNTPLITTEEIADKRLYVDRLKHGENCYIIKGDVTVEAIAEAVRNYTKMLREQAPRSEPMVNFSAMLRRNRDHAKRLLDSLEPRRPKA
jgi:glycosyltransferase involved in cell wall biosynthesis